MQAPPRSGDERAIDGGYSKVAAVSAPRTSPPLNLHFADLDGPPEEQMDGRHNHRLSSNQETLFLAISLAGGRHHCASVIGCAEVNRTQQMPSAPIHDTLP